MKKLHFLNPEQQQFASENHHIVERFLARKRLDAREFYDVVIFGFLSAVQEYLEKPELKAYAFSTIAWRCMNDCLADEAIYQNCLKRTACITPFDEDCLSIDALLPNRIQKMAEILDSQKRLIALLSHITPKEQEVVYLKADGYTYQEIAEKCNLTINGVESRFHRMRRRLRALALM